MTLPLKARPHILAQDDVLGAEMLNEARTALVDTALWSDVQHRAYGGASAPGRHLGVNLFVGAMIVDVTASGHTPRGSSPSLRIVSYDGTRRTVKIIVADHIVPYGVRVFPRVSASGVTTIDQIAPFVETLGGGRYDVTCASAESVCIVVMGKVQR